MCNFNKVKETLFAWVYSWMKPVCDSEEAYLFSKYILKQWLESTMVRESVGDDMAGRISYFLDKHIYFPMKVTMFITGDVMLHTFMSTATHLQRVFSVAYQRQVMAQDLTTLLQLQQQKSLI